MRQDFTLYKRGRVWYGQVPDERNPEKRIRFSTGKTNKAEAIRFCQERFESIKGRGGTFLVYSEKWFTKDCPYLRETLRNGGSIGQSYMDQARSTLENHILPAFGRYRITEITAGMIEDWKYGLVELKGLSKKSANTYLSVLRTMFDFWWRRGELKENPCDRVKWMKTDRGHRGMLTPEEAYNVLTHPEYWGNPIAYLANLLAACTGMRAGEIQALRAMDFTETKIIVSHSWLERYGTLKDTKTGIVREIPIDPKLRAVLLTGKSPGDFIFTMKDRPIYKSCMLQNLKRALNRMGLTYEEQDERGICFHSWRHYLNSRMRVQGIPDVITREITGHTTEEMTDRYTHITAEDSVGLLEIQSVFMPKSPTNAVFQESEVRTQPVEND